MWMMHTVQTKPNLTIISNQWLAALGLYHMFCPQNDHATLWRHAVHDLVMWLKSVNTDPYLTGAITNYLFSRGTRDFSSCTANCTILSPSHQMNSIVFLNISWGRLPTAWSSHQDAFYHELGSRRSGHTWAKTLSCRLISLVHSQWLFAAALSMIGDSTDWKGRLGKHFFMTWRHSLTLGALVWMMTTRACLISHGGSCGKIQA